MKKFKKLLFIRFLYFFSKTTKREQHKNNGIFDITSFLRNYEHQYFDGTGCNSFSVLSLTQPCY